MILLKIYFSEVNRPVSNTNHRFSYQRQSNTDLNESKPFDFDQPQRSKTTREERIRIKRGNATDIPVTTAATTTTTKTTDEQTSSAIRIYR